MPDSTQFYRASFYFMKSIVNTIYFSPTGNTKLICECVAEEIAQRLNRQVKVHDFTTPHMREHYPEIKHDDYIILGVPVYAGRVPNLMLSYLEGLKTNGAKAVAIVTYGNRHYDDALIELKDILQKSGSEIVAAAAFIGEHSFSTSLAAGRPNTDDLSEAKEFATRVVTSSSGEQFSIPGTPYPYTMHYMPKRSDGSNNDIRKVVPITTDDCVNCGLCVSLCPMGSIVKDNPKQVNGICIKCCACVKSCPQHAKQFIAESFLYHKDELEAKCSDYKTNEFYSS